MKKLVLVMVSVFILVLAGCGKEEAKTPEYNYTPQEILEAIKAAMGDKYLPNMPLDDEMVTNIIGIDLELVESYVAEIPMISVHSDRVIIVKAKEGKMEELLPLLEEATQKLIENTFYYPQGMEKVHSAKLVHQGDYAGILMLGSADNPYEDEAERKEFAEKEIQVAVDAFNKMFEK